MGEGLTRVAKMHGGITVKSGEKSVHWVYDFHRKKARIESEMTADELDKSEIARRKLDTK